MAVAIATTNQLAADAGALLSDAGGNAVDVGVAAALVTMVTEPGVCAPGGGGYITIGGPGMQSVTIDGNVEMPGLGADQARVGVVDHVARMEYGGGVTTTVGYCSVATPGGLAALSMALRMWGRMPWSTVLQPAIDIVRRGFPLSSASRHYLGYSHQSVFGWQQESFEALHRDDGTLFDAGELIQIPALARSLEHLAEYGARSLYQGDLGAAIAADFEQHGGILTRTDLAAYRPILRPASSLRFGHWTVATNPPPAIGGVSLLAMMSGLTISSNLDEEEVVARQLWTRRHRLDIEQSGDYVSGTAALARLLSQAEPGGMRAPSTVHTSAVDRDGLACALTMSAGYGSGLMPGGTGMWMNNALGEEELNPAGFHALRPGTRLGSNMAPTIAISDADEVLAIGSPGADRITSALQQTIVRVLAGVMLADAVNAPRLHVEVEGDDVRVAIEPGVDADALKYPARTFDALDMYFGGVGAAMWDGATLIAAADPRRTGGVFVGS